MDYYNVPVYFYKMCTNRNLIFCTETVHYRVRFILFYQVLKHFFVPTYIFYLYAYFDPFFVLSFQTEIIET